ncbi:ABC transporter ATP-binding protein [Tessaracoccus caeni]|uniref:ABC transporter ATP-binding protein n=1 Tax=Tessaracoccus caeni TaxID=3031239 RepID=UPI0023D9DDDF|nr:ABC transporter ATP-binding protein [Tessaracoccus caeni]MDF1489874.1 ABC transporter ATP-binding protein [Tessaracoccus caeni]
MTAAGEQATVLDRPGATSSGPTPSQALARLIAPIKARLVLSVLLGSLGAVLRVTALVLSGLLVTRLIQGSSAPEATGWVAAIIGAMVGSAVLSTLGSVVSHQAAFDHESMMRRDITTHLGRLPLGTVQRLGAGGVKKIVHGDVRGMHSAIADSPSMLGGALGGMLAALLAIGLIEWRLLLVVLAILPLFAITMGLSMRDYASEREAYDRSLEAIDAASVEYVQGMQEVRTFDGGSESFSRFAERVQAFTAHMRAWNDRTRGAALASRILIAPLPVTILLAIAGYAMAGAGWIQPMSVVVVLLLASLPVDAFSPLMFLTDHNMRAMAAALRITQVLDLPALPEAAQPQRPADGSVRLDRVCFSYDADRAPALTDVSIDIPAGSVCALVGPSGSGKSTVARLVPRFFDVTAGSIQVGGVDVREIAPDELLRHIALVFQDPFLLHASIRENLTLGVPGATDEQIQRACRAARIHDEILALPAGYDTVVGERGASLSGGQRQRVTVARALLSDAQVVILDEATAFADPENEAAIQDAVAELTKGRTVIVIAHRLSTIVDADQIVVLDHGRVVETGTHEQLATAGGRYARLWDRHLRAQGWGLRREAEEALS